MAQKVADFNELLHKARLYGQYPRVQGIQASPGRFLKFTLRQMMLSITFVPSGYIASGADYITSKEIPQMNYFEGFYQPLDRIKKFRSHFSKATLEVTAVTVLVHARH